MSATVTLTIKAQKRVCLGTDHVVCNLLASNTQEYVFERNGDVFVVRKSDVDAGYVRIETP